MAMTRGEDRSSFQRGCLSWSRDYFGITKATEGLTWVDPTLVDNIRTLRSEGKHAGFYHFFHPALSAGAQAHHFVSTINANGGYKPGDMFVADVEITVGVDGMEVAGQVASRRMNLPVQAVASASVECHHVVLSEPVDGVTEYCDNCRELCGGEVKCSGCALAEAEGPHLAAVGPAALAFLNEVRHLVGPHNPVLLYTDLSMAVNNLGACAEYPLFLAAYQSTMPAGRVGAWSRLTLWQSAAGGGEGGGDTDWFPGTEAEFDAFIERYVGPPPAELPRWQATIYGRLPRLTQHDQDQNGQPEWVRQAQLLINVQGIQLAVDGYYGAKTVAAVTEVQKAIRVTPTGNLTADTWPALCSGARVKTLPTLQKGSKDGSGPYKEVHRVQACLNAHGIPVTIDGDFGQATEDAVKVVQHGYSEAADGVVGPVTWSLLLAHVRP